VCLRHGYRGGVAPAQMWQSMWQSMSMLGKAHRESPFQWRGMEVSERLRKLSNALSLSMPPPVRVLAPPRPRVSPDRSATARMNDEAIWDGVELSSASARLVPGLVQ
jgi:hypothetical protein